MTPAAWILSLPVRAYRLVLSPFLGHACRFQPTCSVYALDALERHGALRGGWLALRRIGRCHPWGSSGYDPVPGTVRPEDMPDAVPDVAPDPAAPDTRPQSAPPAAARNTTPRAD